MLELDLQFFAKEGPGGEKTEEATSKKLQDARKHDGNGKPDYFGKQFTLRHIYIKVFQDPLRFEIYS